jgi:predicted DNA repair protein MutK
MAGGSLLALLDDITTVLDDVSVMTKVAAKKTAGVLGDDLALNAQQVAGIQAERELPVVWAVAKGSFINKLILVPAALLISAIAPWLITPLLMIGGAYLCFEGFEKIAHKLLHSHSEAVQEEAELLEAAHNPDMDMVAFEQDKIKGAIRTDFVLSAEIIVIALGVVEKMPFLQQVLSLSAIAILMTVGVYGLVAGIVKLDDLGFYLTRDRASGFRRALGNGILAFAPWLMKTLSVVGTAAMFLVGGGILLHGIPHSHDFLHGAELFVQQVGWLGGVLAAITPTLLSGLFGVLAGGLVLAVVAPVSALLGKFRQAS